MKRITAAQKYFATCVYAIWFNLSGLAAGISFYGCFAVRGIYSPPAEHYFAIGIIFSAICVAALIATIHCIRLEVK